MPLGSHHYTPTRSCPHPWCLWLHRFVTAGAVASTILLFIDSLLLALISIVFGVLLAYVIPRALFRQSLDEMVAELDDEVTEPDPRWSRIAVGVDISMGATVTAVLGLALAEKLGLTRFGDSDAPMWFLAAVFLFAGATVALNMYVHSRAAGPTSSQYAGVEMIDKDA